MGSHFYDWQTNDVITAARLNEPYDASGNLTLAGSKNVGTATVPIVSITLDNGVTDEGCIYFNSATTYFIKSAAGVLTLGGFTGLTLPATLTALILGGAVTVTGTWTNLGTVTTVDINGGTIDGATIGGASAGAGTFTTLIITSMGGNWTNAGRTVADGGILTTVDINGGTIDGTTIGAATPAAGSFTTSTLTAQSGMMAGQAAAQTMGTAAYTTLICETEYFDNLNEHNTGTGVFTAAAAGTYAVSWAAESASAVWAATEVWVAWLSKNNLIEGGKGWKGSYHKNEGASTNTRISVGSVVVKLAASDTLRVKVYHDQGGDVNTSSDPYTTYFSVARIA